MAIDDCSGAFFRESGEKWNAKDETSLVLQSM
jgi:hypothetical protein